MSARAQRFRIELLATRTSRRRASHLDDLNEQDWRLRSQVVRHHGLEDFTLGRFATSLRELDRALWDARIATFTQRPLSELGHCRVAVR